MNETNWLPGVVVLGGALVGGIALALRARRGPPIPSLVRGRGVDLERQRDGLYEQIQQLDAGRDRMEVEDYRRERLRLELEAARTLQAMDLGAAPKPAATATPRDPTWGERHPRLVNVLWGGGAGLFVAAVAFSVQDMAKEAPAGSMGGGMGGGGMSGGAAQTTPATDPRFQAALAEAKAAADASPDDAVVQLRYAKLLLDSGALMDAFQIARKVTDKDPENPTARTYQAAVLIEIGDLDTAGKALDRILTAHPEHVEALAYRGLVHYLKGERTAAAAKWEQVIVLDPSKALEFQPLVAMARNPDAPATMAGAAAAATGAPVSGGPMSGAPSGPMSGGSTAARAPDPADVVGRIELGAGVGGVPPGSTLFLFARPSGAERGPPAAAVRLSTSTFPLDFRIGPADSPMGGPFPPQMTLSARIDADGNPTTKSADDLEARVEGVASGASGLVLTLAHPTP